jgi:hypothetical protein
MAKSTARSVAPSPIQRANQNHRANQGNPNRGTGGTNAANAQVHGNRGAQLNPNRRPR